MTNICDTNIKHFVPKGWGFEKWIVNKSQYCGKILYFVKGKKCSFHYHKQKDEVFYVQSGRICVIWSDRLEEVLANPTGDYCNSINLSKGDVFHVPPGRVHQIYALEDSEIVEFSTEHFDEDSYRIIRGD